MDNSEHPDRLCAGCHQLKYDVDFDTVSGHICHECALEKRKKRRKVHKDSVYTLTTPKLSSLVSQQERIDKYTSAVSSAPKKITRKSKRKRPPLNDHQKAKLKERKARYRAKLKKDAIYNALNDIPLTKGQQTYIKTLLKNCSTPEEIKARIEQESVKVMEKSTKHHKDLKDKKTANSQARYYSELEIKDRIEEAHKRGQEIIQGAMKRAKGKSKKSQNNIIERAEELARTMMTTASNPHRNAYAGELAEERRQAKIYSDRQIMRITGGKSIKDVKHVELPEELKEDVDNPFEGLFNDPIDDNPFS